MRQSCVDHRERPILFKAEMVRAVLCGRKTVTRRILKPQPPAWVTEMGYTCFTPDRHISGRGIMEDGNIGEKFFRLKHGVAGDNLWVRETFSLIPEMKPSGYFTSPHWINRKAFYAADNDRPTWGDKWKPSIFMKREMSRISLAISRVTVERLQEITPEDAMAEGVDRTEFWKPSELKDKPFEDKWWDDYRFWTNYPQMVFKTLWESINGSGSWDLNPWVEVIRFEKIADPRDVSGYVAKDFETKPIC